MKLYLSSSGLGNEVSKLKVLLQAGATIGYINNARDWVGADAEIRAQYQTIEMEELRALGYQVEPLDLKDYFHKTEELRQKLAQLDGVWVSGGNTFVLRQAMHLSGFDVLFEELKLREDFVYGGYSAGVCVLCDSLKYIRQVDDADNFPFEACTETIEEGLGYFNYGIIPHYRSNHFESALMEKEVENCIEQKWLFKVLRDGEVLIIEE